MYTRAIVRNNAKGFLRPQQSTTVTCEIQYLSVTELLLFSRNLKTRSQRFYFVAIPLVF